MDKSLIKEKSLNIDKSAWKLTKLGELADDISIRVDNPAQSKYDRFVGLEHFISGDLKIKNWSDTKSLTSSAKAFQKGDILFARRNAYLRRASLVAFDGCCSGDAFVLREKPSKIVPGFLAFLMNSNALWDYANSNAAGTMSKRVKWRDLEEYEFFLPPKDQQAKLAELLWAMDGVVEKEARVKKTLELARKSIIQKFFSNKIYKFRRLSESSEIRYGITLNSNRQNLELHLPYLRVANVSRGKIDLSEVKNIGCTHTEFEAYKLMAEDVLIVEGHADLKEIGRAAVWNNSTNQMLHQNHLIRVRNINGLKSIVLEAYINSSFGQSYFQANAKSTSGLNTINSSIVKDFKVPIIDQEVQMQFILKKEIMDKTLRQITHQLTSSKSLQKSLINQIF